MLATSVVHCVSSVTGNAKAIGKYTVGAEESAVEERELAAKVLY